MQIKQICKPIQDKLNQKLLESIPTGDPKLYQAASYFFNHGGKRGRPLVLLLACHDLCGDMERGYDAALALEMIHNYSLIHDDLPCMDNDDFRRGVPTVHKAFDEATAVLCGDFLFTQAFSVLSESSTLSDTQKVQLTAKLSYYAGGTQLILGQSLDLGMENQVGSIEDLHHIYIKKTSSLFCCALECAAILAQVSADIQSLLVRVGEKLGLAFQIQNDLIGQSKEAKQNKFTILSLLDLKGAQRLKQKYFNEALALLDQCDHSFTLIKDFFSEIVAHEV